MYYIGLQWYIYIRLSFLTVTESAGAIKDHGGRSQGAPLHIYVSALCLPCFLAETFSVKRLTVLNATGLGWKNHGMVISLRV